jgi:hypothetical protein
MPALSIAKKRVGGEAKVLFGEWYDGYAVTPHKCADERPGVLADTGGENYRGLEKSGRAYEAALRCLEALEDTPKIRYLKVDCKNRGAV